MHRLAVVFVVGVLFTAAPAAAQQSRCADCHVANPDAPGHLGEWDVSPHGRGNVGCEACHGGDATTFERVPAHRGILNAANPASPVHRTNLPATCGTCHTGPFVAFQKSRHFALLGAGDPNGPTCSTCHGEVAARLLSPRGLESRCARCHAPNRPAGHPEFPALGRTMHEGVIDVRAALDQARAMIRRVKNTALRAELEAAWQQAEVPLIEARQSGHAFVFDNLEERLGVARRRTDALLDRLANQQP
jgi:hypothetical protein